MNINITEITDKNIRNNFVTDNFKFYSFLNSRQRWEFQKLEGHKIFRLGIIENNNLIWLLLLIKFEAKRWTYFLCPHWPLIKWDYFEVLKKFLPELKKLCKQENVGFIRFCPQVENTLDNLDEFENLWLKFAPIHAHAEETHLLDLTLDESVLKENMRKTTRYIVNRAEKEWVKVILDSSEENIERFIGMHHKHAHRTNWKLNYSAFSSRYIHNLYKVFDPSEITTMNAVYNDEIEASLVTLRFWKTCVYYLGASEIKNPKFSPAYYLQWEAIRKAKSDWCVLYNFWWVSPDENPKHPLHWVSLFKRWFGGNDYNLLHAQDFVVSPKYRINYVVEKVRSRRRGYYFVRPKEKII